MHHMYHIDMNVYNTCDGTKHKYKIRCMLKRKYIYASFALIVFVCDMFLVVVLYTKSYPFSQKKHLLIISFPF